MDIRKSFHQQLVEVQRDIVRLAGMVTEIIPRGTDVLLRGDLREAKELIEGDDLLDVLTLEIEERCYQLLALQQPMASDLRAIVTALRMLSEIERSGDLVTNIAKAARRLYGADLDPRLRGYIGRMGEESARLFRLAIDAYVEHDADKAAALDDLDDVLDDLHREYIQAIFESQHGRALDLQVSVQLALVGRYYERIGDHAVNISERVQYMITGWLPEHTGAARAAARGRVEAEREADDLAADGQAPGGVVLPTDPLPPAVPRPGGG
jgi:phosphate transport system protein